MKKYTVTAAIFINADEILCMQRDASKYEYISMKYEFPGGKVEPGETFEQALVREIAEEMDVQLKQLAFYMTIHHVYPDFEITMHCYKCPVDTRVFVRKEHIHHVWLKPALLNTLDWAPADWPIVERLMKDGL